MTFVIEKGLDYSPFKTDTPCYLQYVTSRTHTLRFTLCSPVRFQDSVSLDMMFISFSLYLISPVQVSLELSLNTALVLLITCVCVSD